MRRGAARRVFLEVLLWFDMATLNAARRGAARRGTARFPKLLICRAAEMNGLLNLRHITSLL